MSLPGRRKKPGQQPVSPQRQRATPLGSLIRLPRVNTADPASQPQSEAEPAPCPGAQKPRSRQQVGRGVHTGTGHTRGDRHRAHTWAAGRGPPCTKDACDGGGAVAGGPASAPGRPPVLALFQHISVPRPPPPHRKQHTKLWTPPAHVAPCHPVSHIGHQPRPRSNNPRASVTQPLCPSTLHPASMSPTEDAAV